MTPGLPFTRRDIVRTNRIWSLVIASDILDEAGGNAAEKKVAVSPRAGQKSAKVVAGLAPGTAVDGQGSSRWGHRGFNNDFK